MEQQQPVAALCRTGHQRHICLCTCGHHSDTYPERHSVDHDGNRLPTRFLGRKRRVRRVRKRHVSIRPRKRDWLSRVLCRHVPAVRRGQRVHHMRCQTRVLTPYQVPLYLLKAYTYQVPATTRRTRSVASRARWENIALPAHLSACAAHWLTAQHRAVAQSLRINAYARSATSWPMTPARCAQRGLIAPALG